MMSLLQCAVRGWLAGRRYERILAERRYQVEQRAAIVIQVRSILLSFVHIYPHYII